MSVETFVELGAIALALWAVWLSIPKAPSFDHERLFKFALANALRGEAEAMGGDLATWRAAVLGHVLYHPSAGAEPERLLTQPDPAALPVPSHPGARALVERLAALPDGAQRRRYLYEDDPAVEQTLLGHPDDLGTAYDPAGRFAPGVSWDSLAAWADPVVASLQRRFDAAVLVDLGAGSVASDMADAVPGVRCVRVDGTGLDESALAAAIIATVQGPVERVILVAEGEDAASVLGALAVSAALRDRLMASVSIRGVFGALGSPARERVASVFTHERLDPEVHRALPYLTLLDGASSPESWAEQRLPTPPDPVTGRVTIDLLDLGPCDIDGLSRPALARALWILLNWRLA